ncbi:hypothetical protein [Reichenbachiella sp. 5M10]|uniref:hypothetical protein n=1 Tax=Reichenbachiella sp. 5M10 TaxID=1889772 RepID=UPI001C874779|nr:hypothetical protein [Reichenbachiella sp. 5M10]
MTQEDMPTRKVDRKVKEDTRRNQPDQSKLSYIYVDSGRRLLYGNPCALEVTHNMGFEYVLEHRPDQTSREQWRRFQNNLWVKTKLIFTKGPWWKSTVNKRFKECAQASGDFRG